MGDPCDALLNDPEIKPLLTRVVDTREVPINYMRHAQRESERQEIDLIDRKLTDPVERRFLQNPAKLKQQNDRRKANLLAQSPPTDLRPSQRNKLLRLERSLREAITENMPTAEAMRHNPPGAVDHHRAWERANKPKIIAWKNVRILLNPESDATDLANLERYRPSAGPHRNLYADAQIPGQWALSPQGKAQYEGIDWESPEVAAQIERLIAEGKVKVRVSGTPAQGRAKPPKGSASVTARCEVDGCGAAYRGGFGPANLLRHMATAHGIREEVPA